MKEKNIVKVIITSSGDSKNIRLRDSEKEMVSTLSITGEFQAKLLGDRLNRYIIDLIVSNSAEECKKTAIEIAYRQEFRAVQKLDDDSLSLEKIKKHCYQNKEEYRTICFVVSKDEMAKFIAKIKKIDPSKHSKYVRNTAVTVLEYDYVENTCKILVENSISHLELKKV